MRYYYNLKYKQILEFKIFLKKNFKKIYLSSKTLQDLVQVVDYNTIIERLLRNRASTSSIFNKNDDATKNVVFKVLYVCVNCFFKTKNEIIFREFSINVV